MKKQLISTLGLALLTAGAMAQTTATKAQSSLARVYAQRLAEWEAAANRKDASSIAALYTEDALLMPPNAPAVRGRAAVEAFFKGLFDQGARDVKLVQIGPRAPAVAATRREPTSSPRGRSGPRPSMTRASSSRE